LRLRFIAITEAKSIDKVHRSTELPLHCLDLLAGSFAFVDQDVADDFHLGRFIWLAPKRLQGSAATHIAKSRAASAQVTASA